MFRIASKLSTYLAVFTLAASIGSPLAGQGRLSHVLFGDLKVQDTEDLTSQVHSYSIVLLASTGRVFARDSVAPGGRFRFNDVPNGDWELVVRIGTREIHRERLMIFEFKPSEVRVDLEFTWSQPEEETPPLNESIVYARSQENQDLLNEAIRLGEEGRHDQARRTLQQLLSRDPLDFEAQTEFGTCLFRKEQYREAIEAYQEALRMQPDFFPALLNLGRLYLVRSRFDQALKTLQQAVAEDDENATAHYLVGEAYLGLRLGSKALPALEKALDLDPDGMAEVHLRIAQLYDAAGYTALASQEYQDFLEKRPDSAAREELLAYISAHTAEGR